MKQGFDISVTSSVSESILTSAKQVQLIRHNWSSLFQKIQIKSEHTQHLSMASNLKRGIGLFFSGGVDSFYTLKKHKDKITHLIFVQGFDIPIDKTNYNQIISERLKKVAETLNLEFVEVQTNIRQYSDRYVHWEDYFGQAMAAVAHFLAPNFEKFYIPSSCHYAFLYPCGSHPGLDPLWGNDHLQLIHDGCEASRFERIIDICKWKLALDNLRVCWQVKEGQYNCCQCRKCLWTMAFLRAINKLSEAKTFPQPLNLEAFSQHILYNLDNRFRVLQAIALLEERGDDPELLEAMQKALNRKNYWGQMQKAIQKLTKSSIDHIINSIFSKD